MSAYVNDDIVFCFNMNVHMFTIFELHHICTFGGLVVGGWGGGLHTWGGDRLTTSHFADFVNAY